MLRVVFSVFCCLFVFVFVRSCTVTRDFGLEGRDPCSAVDVLGWDYRRTPPYDKNWSFYVQIALPRPFYLMNAHVFAFLTLFGLLCCFALKIRWLSVHAVAPSPNWVSSRSNLGKLSIQLRSLQGRRQRKRGREGIHLKAVGSPLTVITPVVEY